MKEISGSTGVKLTVGSFQPYPALPPMYHPVQLLTGASGDGGALTAISAAIAGVAMSAANPAMAERTFCIGDPATVFAKS
jgi:hypothetical protein